ncbi:Uncharacterised protein [Vibrio cholerae]|nr:Uncharacterised protein [Vibrio cholerae]CSI67811.1 Uncharacterised protein [Vibrio cholerae]
MASAPCAIPTSINSNMNLMANTLLNFGVLSVAV